MNLRSFQLRFKIVITILLQKSSTVSCCWLCYVTKFKKLYCCHWEYVQSCTEIVHTQKKNFVAFFSKETATIVLECQGSLQEKKEDMVEAE